MLRMPSLLESRSDLLHLWPSLERKWIQPTSSPTTSSRRGDLVVLGTTKLKHRKSTMCPTMRGGDVSKRILMEFTIVSYETQYIVTRNSTLAGPRRSACQWINWHTKTTPTAHPLRRMRDVGKTGKSHWTNQAEMHRWNSDQTSEKHWQICTVSTVNLEKSDLNQILLINTKGGVRRLLLPVPHGGSGMNTGGAHNYFSVVVARSFTADGNLLQPTECVNRTAHTTHFLMFLCTHDNVARDIGSRCSVLHIIHVSCACVFDFSSTHHFALFICLSHLLLYPPNLHLHLLYGSVRREFTCALPRMRSLTLWSTTPLWQQWDGDPSGWRDYQQEVRLSKTRRESWSQLVSCSAIGWWLERSSVTSWSGDDWPGAVAHSKRHPWQRRPKSRQTVGVSKPWWPGLELSLRSNDHSKVGESLEMFCEWNHLLCLFNISHCSSTDCSEVMSKRTQKKSGEERFTAKSKPMTNLVSRCSGRTLDVLASTASESPGENQIITSELMEWAASKNSLFWTLTH